MSRNPLKSYMRRGISQVGASLQGRGQTWLVGDRIALTCLKGTHPGRMRSIVADRCSLTSAPRQEEALAADRKRDIQTSSKRALFGLYADDQSDPKRT